MNITFKNFILLDIEEHKKILDIRNSDYVRFNMKNSKIISLNEHFKFIKNLKKNKKNIYYAIFLDDILVGSIDFTSINYKEKKCFWGIYLKQYAHPYLSSLSTYLLINRAFEGLGLEELWLEVNTKNLSAYRLDLNFGFHVCNETTYLNQNYYIMSINKEEWQKLKQKPLMSILKKKLDKIEYIFKEI